MLSCCMGLQILCLEQLLNYWNCVWNCFHDCFSGSWILKSIFLVLYCRIAGWWSLCGRVVTTATPNTFRPCLRWSCIMQSCGPEAWSTTGLCPLSQPAHGVTSGASAPTANWRRKERESYWETKTEKRTGHRNNKETNRESWNSMVYSQLMG